MKFCDNLRCFNHNDLYILNNPYNGSWIKLTHDVYLAVVRMIENNLDNIDISQYTEKDKKYLEKTIDLMKKIGIIDYVDDTKLVKADFAITSKCNLKCKHCSNAIMEGKTEPTREEIERILVSLESVGIKQLCLTGGEPLLRSDFKLIVKEARERFDKLSLLTNGTLVDSYNVEFLKENFDDISISIDGYDEKSCEKIRGCGIFNKVINSINLLKNVKFKHLSLSMVNNVNGNVDEFFLLCERLNVKPVVRKYAPFGRGKESEKSLFLPILDKECATKRKNAQYMFENGVNYSLKSFGTTVCTAFRENIYIDSDLHLYPCGALNMPEFRGDKITDISDLKTYFENEEYKKSNAYKKYQSIQPTKTSYCSDCSVSLFCTDCPAYLYLYNQNGYLNKYCNGCKEYMEKKIYEKY